MTSDYKRSRVVSFPSPNDQTQAGNGSGRQDFVCLPDEAAAASLLNCSQALLRRSRLHRTGPPYVKIGRLVRYRVGDVENHMTAQTRKAAA